MIVLLIFARQAGMVPSILAYVSSPPILSAAENHESLATSPCRLTKARD